jgi:hypothetical protein
VVEMKIRNVLGNRYSGQIGKSTIASSWKGREYVKAYVVPRNPRTERQQEHRKKFGCAKEAWRQLTDEARAEYERRAQPQRISGWNLFVREHVAGRPQRLKPGNLAAMISKYSRPNESDSEGRAKNAGEPPLP